MKILVVHNHYRLRGGEDSVFEAECRMLEDAGHEVLRYEKSNVDLPGGVWGRLRAAFGTVWSRRAYREVREILRRERPDVMHCHNTFPQISPSIYYAAAAEGVPVVQTLHNYRLACLNGYLFRDGRVCERCLGRAPLSGLCHRCYRGSFAASAAAAAMLLVHRALGTWRRKVARYIALSPASIDLFRRASLPAERIVVKPNPYTVESGDTDPVRGPCIAFVGRLSSEKGVDVLIAAWSALRRAGRLPDGAKLLIIGAGPEREALERLAADEGCGESVSFAGVRSHGETLAALRGCAALALPSLCMETFGLAVLDAAGVGVAAIVTAHGGQGALVRDGETGLCVPAGDAGALADAMARLLADPALARRLGENARSALAASACPPEANVRALEAIYRDAIAT